MARPIPKFAERPKPKGLHTLLTQDLTAPLNNGSQSPGGIKNRHHWKILPPEPSGLDKLGYRGGGLLVCNKLDLRPSDESCNSILARTKRSVSAIGLTHPEKARWLSSTDRWRDTGSHQQLSECKQQG